MRKTRIFAILLVIMMLFVGCASIQLDTSAKKYAATMTAYNDLLERYLDEKDKVPVAQQKTIKIAFNDVGEALDVWGDHLTDPDYKWADDVANWLKLKNMVIEILLEVAK